MRRVLYIFLLFLISVCSFSQLKVAGIFGNNAVIQQGIAAPVWGQAIPGATVDVNFAGTETKTIADENGKWMIRLVPMKADGKSYTLLVKSGTEMLEFKNILLGEVWFASGQSNMQWKVSNGIDNQADEVEKANYPDIRFFTVNSFSSAQPLADIPQKDWQVCTPSSINDFSAVSYFFARSLYLDKKVPVGIIVSARGATNLETWMSQDRLITNPDFTESLSKMDSTTWNAKVKKFVEAEKNREYVANNSLLGIKKNVHTLKYNDSEWTKTEFPLNMKKMNYPRFWGLVWIRKSFELPTDATKKEWKLHLPIEDRNDRIYLNGKEIACGVSMLKDKVISIPSKLLKKGKNLLAVRMYVNWGIAEVGKNTGECYLKSTDNQLIELDGGWTHNNTIEPAIAQWEDFYATVNFNGMVHPIIPYGIKGFLWYQGENNVNRFKQYSELQQQLIEDWRVRWGQGYLPFLYVQLTNYKEQSAAPKSDDEWASLRDAQTATLQRSPFTAMVTTIDIGEANNIHSKNKQDVGKRLYLAAKAKAYGSPEIIYSGPLLKSAKLEGSVVRVAFEFSQNGLRTKGNLPLKGFALAGIDGKWFWADAQIDGNEIVASSKAVNQPTKIQYAWQSNPDCNLYNAENLPAVPFNVEINK